MGDSCKLCNICNCDFSVSHWRRNAVSQHYNSTKQQHRPEVQKQTRVMSGFVTKNTSEVELIVTVGVNMAILCVKKQLCSHLL